MDIDNTGQTIRLIDEVPEIWVPINIQDVIGYYEISNYGRIKSKARYDLKGSFRKEKLLKWRKSYSKKKDSPYYHVCLCNGAWQKNFKVHTLVAKYFVDGWFDGATVNHKDGDKRNNFYKNLEWVTLKENCIHRNKEGLLVNVKGNSHGRSKLTEDFVKELYLKYLKGFNRNSIPWQTIADEYGVSDKAIRNIYDKLSWVWLTDTLD